MNQRPRTALSTIMAMACVLLSALVTAPTARGRGLAGSLMVELVARYGSDILLLEAQAHLAEWYGRFGFEIDGDEYLEDGIPHVPMRREPVDM